MHTKDLLSAAVRGYRAEKGLLQKEVAERCGITQGEISKMEAGEWWSADRIDAVAKGLFGTDAFGLLLKLHRKAGWS